MSDTKPTQQPVLPRRPVGVLLGKRGTKVLAAGPAQMVFVHYETPRREKETRIAIRHEKETFFLFPDGSYDKRCDPVATAVREQVNEFIGERLPEERIQDLESEVAALKGQVASLMELLRR